MDSVYRIDFKNILSKVDWKLLLFLILFLNVKLAVKIPAIVIIYLLRFDFKFGFSFKNTRLPLFYPLVMAIALLNLIIYKTYGNTNYPVVFLMGTGFWILCLLAVHQVKIAVEDNNAGVIHH